MRFKLMIWIVVMSCSLTFGLAKASARTNSVEFPAGLPWLNVTQPLTMQQLKGKVVLLDFWTYGCVNCIHVIPDLHKLEQKYGHQLAVISVHSPKFENEKQLSTLTSIVRRYGMQHAVVNDVEFQLWRSYAVRAWPTFVLIGPDGKYVGQTSGEGRYDVLDQAIDQLLAEFKGKPNLTPLPIKLVDPLTTTLAAPGSVTVDERYIAISDTLHNQIVLMDHQGKLVKRLGSGIAELKDGQSDSSAFASPQGLVLTDKALYVADTGNHAIRRIDLTTFQVSTLAGNGELAQGRLISGSTPTQVSLRSPWDLALDNNTLYIAMAGSHQIWTLDLKSAELKVFAGTGQEALVDGKRRDSAFNQPSGLALRGNKLWVADAEASAVRQIDLSSGKVDTLVGQGLFEFGLKDGAFKRALLQHNKDVVVLDKNTLAVADTYNHKIRLLDLDEQQVMTLSLGTELNEPGGLAVFNSQLYIADTNNNRILRWQLKEQKLSEIQVPASAKADTKPK
ncbi:redoxin domain-containing protein [Rheinheimera sediminis]|uniref:thioredoxin-like domain-containing protein n=1 Tax=Rheinheimera sp. YQF-1 TaxID=2499626 RepID=UPI000FDC3E04|nr:thioredoxin-like domain-containing protein [Rheinheimera sp. YQF-1]RVT46788.1 redoxin domain-containing protein [Rheinheimera sp. YQF-1]